MQRQSLGQTQLRRSKYRVGGGFLVRFLWLCGYLSVTFAALLSTYAFPELLSVFRQQRSQKYTNYQITAKGGDMGVQSRRTELSWKQEFLPPHVSRGNPANVTADNHDGYNKLWKPPPNRDFTACVDPSAKYKAPPLQSRGYLLVSTNGGLNQMRAGICDMVAVARLINATLVIPELDKRSFWADNSNFSDIFDDDYFIEALRGDVPVVKKLPPELASAPRASRQFRSWSNTKYYEEEVASLWDEYQVIKASKSDARLANNDLPSDIQKLRCRVHYDALRFAPVIEAFGKMLVERLRANGPFIALHLRYEKDMLAFTGCTYGLTEEDADLLTLIRYRTPHWKVKEVDAAEQRAKGFCPLTPKEVGIFLKSLGYPESTQIYVAAGEIYGGDERMADLRMYFPNLLRKETVATADELAPFKNHASQMAALDYIVSVESDVFVPSYSGNMARAVEGHRRFLGHRKTIIPDRKELVALFDKLEIGELEEGSELSRSIVALHRQRQGAPRKRKGPLKGTKGRDRFRTEEAFYTNPLPDCLCQKPGMSGKASSSRKHQTFLHAVSDFGSKVEHQAVMAARDLQQ
ncbi:hypothetical protein Mapa_008801 [Marchantia paleacea]|nr:hypothetical protein Mapa_008801 [Marchantia paleacea]